MFGHRIIPPKQITCSEARSQMLQFLYGCRIEALMRTTAADLVRQYRGMKLAAAEFELEKAKAARRSEAA